MVERTINRVTNIISSCFKQITTVIIFFNFSIYSNPNKNGIIYIGEWTDTGLKSGYPDLKVGQHGFITRNCSFVNCFYTTEHYYFNDIKNYDVLLFNARSLNGDGRAAPNRSGDQLYVFIGFEPATYFPVSDPIDSFDLTFTYKLSSDIVRPFFIVKNNRNEVIGPRKYMCWETDFDDMKSTNQITISKLMSKQTAAIFLSPPCDTKPEQIEFVKKLQTHLSVYGQQVDIYGGCEQLQCQRKHETGKLQSECSVLIQKYYYFYLAFEDVFAEDYVTENLLYALNNYAVPVVYGGANYSRFVAAIFFLVSF